MSIASRTDSRSQHITLPALPSYPPTPANAVAEFKRSPVFVQAAMNILCPHALQLQGPLPGSGRAAAAQQSGPLRPPALGVALETPVVQWDDAVEHFVNVHGSAGASHCIVQACSA